MRPTCFPRQWLLAFGVAFVPIAIATLPAGCAARPAALPDPTPVVKIPHLALPSPNAFDYDVQAGKALVDRDKIDHALDPSSLWDRFPSSPPYSLVRKEQLVRENAEALRLVRAGFKFPFVSEPMRSETPDISYYPKIRELSRLFKLEEQIEEGHGDWGAAASSDLDAVRLGEDLPHGAIEIGWLVGLACQALGRKPIWALIPHLTAPQARAAARRLEAIEARHTQFVLVMQEEEWTGQAHLLAVFAKPNWRQAMLDDEFRDFGIIDNGDSSTQTLRFILQTALRQSTKQSLFDTYTRYREEFVRSARAPYAAHVPIKRVPRAPDDMMAFFAFKFDPYKSLQWRDASSQSQNALLMTALVLRAYRLEHGTYPPTLNVLVPRYLSKVPADPFALAGPLRYRPSGDRYILYSIGPDGRDNHGTAIYDPSKPAPLRPGASNQRYGVLETSQGDIVAGVNLF